MKRRGAIERLYEEYWAEVGDGDVLESLRAASAGFLKERAASVGDAATTALALGSILAGPAFDASALTPQMVESFSLAFPNREIENIASMSGEELSGLLSAWKGKLFEVIVRDRLNEGQWVGDLHLDAGQTAELAESATQPEWDLLIRGADGSIANEIQLKATESLSYVEAALEKYPGTEIVTTAEIADAAGDLDRMISVTDIADFDLTASLEDGIGDGLADSVLDAFLPGLPFLFIASTETIAVLAGRREASDAVVRAVRRTGKAVVSGLIGYGIGLLFGDIFGIGAAVVTRLLLGGEAHVPAVAPSAHQSRPTTRRTALIPVLNREIELRRRLLPTYALWAE